MERAETWPQYAMMTPFACNLMQALAAERAQVATAYGHVLDSLGTFFHRASHVPMAPLHEMTAAIAAARPELNGPNTTESRYVTEDVPFGLAYYLAIAAPKRVAMPLTAAMVALLEALWGCDLRTNPMLAALDMDSLPALLRNGAGRA
jgi:opine dehydrogenase